MSITFFPRVVKFFDLFQRQNKILEGSVALLSDLFEKHSGVSEICGRIGKYEIEGNEVSREIAHALALTFITPIDREDIHAINMAQENALNTVRAISTRIGLYNFREIRPGARELVVKLRLMHEEISFMIELLRARKQVELHAHKVKELKREADMLLLVSLGEVYESNPVAPGDFLEMMKWSHIYDRIEDSLANTEFLSNVIEGVSLKNA